MTLAATVGPDPRESELDQTRAGVGLDTRRHRTTVGPDTREGPARGSANEYQSAVEVTLPGGACLMDGKRRVRQTRKAADGPRGGAQNVPVEERWMGGRVIGRELTCGIIGS